MQITDFKVLTFDCYGTLIDWETGLVEALNPLTSRLSRPLTRDEILEAYARHEGAQQHYTPTKRYSELLAVVYKRLSEEWALPVSWDECVAFGQSIKDWPAFPDSAEALLYLKDHYKLVILSNVDNASFAESNKRLKVAFDAIFTAEDIGSYKPNLRNFEYMLEKLTAYGITRGDILHTAQSLYHDHRPANELGLTSCWIDRRHTQQGYGATRDPGTMPRYAFRFNSMGEFADAHKALVRN
ncbi:haloacid dehalogenase type II [Rhodoligotrophos defluvii]|uniref:haloacid dehalogenase type II n=1 Tax=Rhodoligotrophos defluvii TaxID=2561934 RepID=UPI0010C98F84|nr:haloacid dehalogenase type II [Rhodoligotrophos defluvii]